MAITLKQFLSQDVSEETLKSIGFEEGLKLLEALVAQVESGSLTLETAICAYERGALLVTHLRGHLSGAEEKLRVVQKSASS